MFNMHIYDPLAPMWQTYANFPCTSVINYRSEAGNGSKESARARVPITVHCTVSVCRYFFVCLFVSCYEMMLYVF